MLRRLLIVMMALMISASLFSQSGGTLNGTITTDDAKGEPIPFANVSILQNGNIVTGVTTDMDGKYSIKPIPAGKYTVSASFVGYNTAMYTDVRIPGGVITFLNIKLKVSAEILDIVEVIEYKDPLIAADQTQTGGTATSEQIRKMPGRSVDAIASTVGGVFSENGQVGSIRGARSDGTSYYVDGVKVRGSSSVPKSALEQVQVITGGIPASYGDATGGVISMTTKGPTSLYFGGAEYVTSEFLDGYGYNLGGLTVSGPIWSIKNEETGSSRTAAGFLVSLEGYMIKDPKPSALGEWRANPEVTASLIAEPLKLIRTAENAIINNNAEHLLAGDFINKRSRQNAATKGLNLAGKVDVSPIKDLNITFGGTLDVGNRRNYDRTNQLFNSDLNGFSKSNTWRVYGRLTQRFRDNSAQDSSQSFIKNPYYSIQVDYSKSNYSNYDKDFKSDVFKYGHYGKFNTVPEKFYAWGVDSATNLQGMLQETYYYNIKDFTPGEYNPYLARYTEQFFNYFGEMNYIQGAFLTGNGGLLNGQAVPTAYGMFGLPGTRVNSYGFSELTQFRVSAHGSADVKSHAISIGFEFEQRSDAGYGVSPRGLWTLARQLTNKHILERDIKNPIVYRDEEGLFKDTIDYPRIFNPAAQSVFDKNLRDHLGLANNGLDWLDIDSYDPSELNLEWFSPDELFNDGRNYVSYYGYDYKGNKLGYRPSLSDFFNQVDANGSKIKTRPIAAFEPSYIAGYIQDKFAFNDLIFNIGLRVDRYDANQMVLKDMYLFENAYTAGDKDPKGLLSIQHPDNIPGNAVVYVNDLVNPTAINGYRVGNVWYNAAGTEVENPNQIASANGISPYIIDVNSENKDQASAFEDYKPQVVVMPRIAFSFPISDEALFFAHYDILSKRPLANRLNPINYLYIRQFNNDLINNPNLKAEKTIDYELGYQQKVSNTSAMTLSAFYREMRDMVQAISVVGAYPTNYYTYGNIDFGTVKGFTFSYDLRRTGNVTLKASYTLQFANATGSNYESAKSIVMSDKPNLRTTVPTDQDQRHAISLSFDYRFGGKVSNTNYDGPKINGKNLFENTGVNFIVNTGSGTPYTKKDKPRNGINLGSINGANKPWRFNVNMRLDRDFKIKLANKKDVEGSQEKNGHLNVYLEVSNLLNLKTQLYVYPFTGNADDNGYLTHADYQNEIAAQTNEEAYRNYYAISINDPDRYALPRTIRLGVQFSF